MKVYLMGDMGERFGEEWTMNAPYLRDVLQLIGCQRKGFFEYLRSCAEGGVNFAVQRGEEFLGEEELELNLAKQDIIITPIPAGAGGDVGKIIAGVFLIALAVFPPTFFGSIGSFFGGTAAGVQTVVGALGVNLALQGVQGLLMPGPEQDRDTPDSYIFNGPVNTVSEGLPVPLLYGELIVGGAPINVTFTTQKPSSGGYTYADTENNNNSIVPTWFTLGGL